MRGISNASEDGKPKAFVGNLCVFGGGGLVGWNTGRVEGSFC